MKHAKNERFSMRDLKHYPINQSIRIEIDFNSDNSHI